MLLANSHTLADGLRVRLRLACGRDHAAVLDLAARAGSPCGELEAHRLVRASPVDRVAVCALVWSGRREVLAGFAAADLAGGEPDVLLVDEALAPGLGPLLRSAVAERAAACRRTAA